MKRLRPNQKAISYYKVFSLSLGFGLLLTFLAAAFVAYNTPKPLQTAESNNKILQHESNAALPTDRSSHETATAATAEAELRELEDDTSSSHKTPSDKLVVDTASPSSRSTGAVQPAPYASISAQASISSLATWSVSDIINTMVTNADSLQRARMLSALTHSPRGPDQPVYRGFGQKFFNAGHRQCSSECTHATGDGFLHDGLPLTAPPPQMTANETLPAGTWIIAMDKACRMAATTGCVRPTAWPYACCTLMCR